GHPTRELGVPFESRGLPSKVFEDVEEVPGTAPDLEDSPVRHPTGQPVMDAEHATAEKPCGQSPAGGDVILGVVSQHARENIVLHSILPAREHGPPRVEDLKVVPGVLGVRSVVGTVKLRERRTTGARVQNVVATALDAENGI